MYNIFKEHYIWEALFLKKLLVLLLCLTIIGNIALLFNKSIVHADATVEVWKRTDISLTSSKTYANAYLDVSIDAVFTHTDGTTISIPGFWNGGNQLIVRFSPTKTGYWSYVITCSDTTNTGLQNKTGVISAIANSGTTDIDTKGFVKITSGKRYFTYNDGSPFYWLGDTNWQAPNYVAIDKCNYPGSTTLPLGQFQYEVDDRLSKGFTVYQTYFGASESDGGGQISVCGQPSYWTTKYSKINPATFTNKFDKMIDYMASKGMTIALGLGLGNTTPSAMGETALLNYTRYIVARYASYPIIWITAQEITGDAAGYAVWKDVDARIDQLDGYRHPLGAHMVPTYYSGVVDLDSQPWHDWWTLQAGHGGLAGVQPQALYQSFFNSASQKPYVEAEANYEDITCGGFTGYDASRVCAWKANQCGSYGFTYGATGVWANCYSTSVNTGWLGSFSFEPWYMGLDKPGSFEMSYLKKFYQYVNFSTLIPRFNSTTYCNFTDDKKVLSTTDDKNTYVAYFYNTTTYTGNLYGLNSGQTYSARWYNPRTGKFIDISNNISVISGTYTIPNKPSVQDWTLLVTSNNYGSYETEAMYTDLLPADTRTNIALGKTAIASVDNGTNYTASKATDGNFSTYWCVKDATFPQWLEVDLGSVQPIKEVDMYCYYTSNSYSYLLEGSLDGNTWTTIVSRSGVHPTVGTLDLLSEKFDASYRYLKVNILSANQWATMYEFQAYSSLRPASDITGIKLYPQSVKCVGSSIYDSNQVLSNTVQYLFDDNYSTEWKPFAPIGTQTIYMDMGVQKSLSNITITPGSGSVLTGFRVEGSNDNKNWTIISDCSIRPPAITQLSGQNVLSASEKLSGIYRYVKLLLLTTGDNSVTKNISEIGLYGANLATPTPAPTPTATPTPTPTVTPAGIVNFNVGNIAGGPGDTVAVNVDISANSTVAAATYVLNYDSTKLQFVSADTGSAIVSGMTDINPVDGKITMTYANTKAQTAGGAILQVQFLIKSPLADQITPFNFQVPELINLSEVNLPTAITQGAVTIVNYKLGDVNSDATITSVDALMALQIASGHLMSTTYTSLAADVDKSGAVTAVDALRVLQFASGRITSF